MKNITKFCLFLIIILAVITGISSGGSGSGSEDNGEIPPGTDSRSFYMGFTSWPPDATVQAVDAMYDFVGDHADMMVHQLDGGIPWSEALNELPLPDNVADEWTSLRESTPDGHKVYIAVTPLNVDRTAMAGYWADDTNMPLPAPWNTYALDHDNVKTAYLNYLKRVITFFDPDYLAIALEANVPISSKPATWQQYRNLHKYIYPELKALYPDLPIFATFVISHMKGIEQNSDSAIQKSEIETLMDYCDILGISAYPYGWAYYPTGKEDPIPENYFDLVFSYNKPIAVTETGAPTKNFSAFGIDYVFDEDFQNQYFDLLFRKAVEHNFKFVVNFTAIDFDKLLDDIPEDGRELASVWAYTGLQQSNGQAKKALTLWDSYLALQYE